MNKKMRLYINSLTLIYILYLFLVFFMKWYNKAPHIVIISLISFIFLYILNIYVRKKIDIKTISIFMIFILYLFINIIFSKSNNQYLKNEVLNYILAPISIALFFKHFSQENINHKVLKYSYIFFNIYYYINFIIMLKQIGKTYFLMRHTYPGMLYKDQITGLMGIDGSHRLTLFYLICLFSNYILFKHEDKAISTFSKINFITIIITSAYISVFNDNRAYYFILILFILPIIFNTIKNTKFSIKNILKGMIGLITLVLTVVLLYNKVEPIKKFIDIEIIEKNIERTTDTISSNKKDEERIRLFKYALSNGNGFGIGMGIGTIRILSDPSMPKHFGISEITSRVYNGGLIYLVCLIILYSHIYSRIAKTDYWLDKLFIVLTVTVLAAYQQIFSICEEVFLCCIVYYLYGIILQNEKKTSMKGNLK